MLKNIIFIRLNLLKYANIHEPYKFFQNCHEVLI